MTQLTRSAWQGNVSFLLVLLAIALMGLILPPSGWGFAPLADLDDAAEFLRTLWQVEAAALALSVAVILFLFQSVASSRPGGDLREFATDSHLLKFLDLGVVALLLVGLTLLGVGAGAPGAWAATWTSLVAGFTILSLSLLFRLAMGAVSEDELHTRRIARLRTRARRSVEADVMSRAAHKILEDICNSEGIQLEPLFARPSRDSARLTSWAAGEVINVNLGKLRELSNEAKSLGGQLTLTASPGETIGQNSLLAYASTPIAEAPRKARQIFRISHRESDDVLEALEQVHTEALRAIRNGDPVAYGRTASIYIEVTAAFADAWAGHKRLLPDPLAGFGFIEDPIRRLLRNLYEELHLVIRGESREIMFEATALPTTISSIAIDHGILSLAQSSLRSAIEMYRLAKTAPKTEVAELALERSWTLLLEHIEYRVTYGIGSEQATHQEKLELLPFAHASFNLLGDLLKIMIDNKDAEGIRRVDAKWGELLEYWEPEHAYLDQLDAKLLEDQYGEDDPRVIEAREQAEQNVELATEKQRLLDTLSQLRFGLAFWSLHRLLQASDKPPFAGIFRHFSSHFDTLNDLVTTTNAILNSEWRGGFNQTWSQWLLEELDPGEAHFIGTDSKLMQTFLVSALIKVNPEADPPGIQPFDWVRLRLDELLSHLDALIGDEELWAALPEVTELPTRRERLAQSLRSAAQAQQHLEDEEVRSSSQDPKKVDEFKNAIRMSLAEHQWIPTLFEKSGQLQPPNQEGPPDEKWFGRKQWIPKEMLLANSRFVGVDMFGESLGRAIADGEAEFLVNSLDDSQRIDTGSGTTREKLENAIITMRSEGFDPSLILIPIDWRLDNELGLVNPFGTAEVPDWVPEAARRSFQGSVKEVPVFAWHSVIKSRIYLVDLSRFGAWKQWLANDQGDVVKIEILDHSPEEALEVTNKFENMFRKPEAESAEERAEELRKHLFLSVHERFTLDISEPAAARWIEVEPHGNA